MYAGGVLIGLVVLILIWPRKRSRAEVIPITNERRAMFIDHEVHARDPRR